MIGTILQEKYAVKALLAESHLYEIFAAVEVETDTDVVIKLMKEDVAADFNRVKMFNEEVRTFAKLSHPGIAQIMDMDTAGKRPFIVTEPVAGVNLLSWARGENPPSFMAAVKAARDIAGILQYALDEGVVRRSAKLSNIMRGDDGTIKLLSFSLPRLHVVGVGSSFDIASGIQSDLFFLGTTIFELITGESPIRKRGGLNETWDDMLRRALRTRHPQLPPASIEKVIETIERTFTREMARRFLDHTAFLKAMADLLHLAEGADRAPRVAVARREMSTASEVVDAINGRNPQAGNSTSELGAAKNVIPATPKLLFATPHAQGVSRGNPGGQPIPIGKAASAGKVAFAGASSAAVSGRNVNSAVAGSGVASSGSVNAPLSLKSFQSAKSAKGKSATLGTQGNGKTDSAMKRGYANPGFDGNAALACDPMQESDIDSDEREKDEDDDVSGFGRPFLKLIKGGRNAAESIIWRAADEPIWYKNPFVLMGSGLLSMILLILFW
ncbi:MAG: protein kinase [Candidatus Ozemobacteraceae bacterium]